MINQEIEYALSLFEKGEYKQCAEAMIVCHNAGVEREWIEEFFYSNFIIPNEEEYKNTFYQVNRSEINYEQCVIDFIPVSESEYYLFDKENRSFCGNITIEGCETYTEHFESVLFSGFWNIQILIDNLRGRLYKNFYTVINEDIERMVSFFKIPQLSRICSRIKAFKSQDDFYDYFIDHEEEYAPRVIISEDNEHWYDLINRIHSERIKNVDKKRDNIFLSICIPSYNRGHRALESVKELLQLPYDSEIEVVVSDNGSTERTEGYEEIKSISQTDSRLVYDRIPVNDSYFENICNVISLASGKYVLTLSDEDHINYSVFDDYLDYLYTHSDLGVGCFSGIGGNMGKTDNGCFDDRVSGVLFSMGQNYLSALTINNDVLKQKGAAELIKSMKNNRYVFLYTHCAFAALSAETLKVYTSDLELCIAGDEDDMNLWGEKKDVKIPAYIYPEDRILQLRGIIDFFFEVLHFALDDFIYVMISRMGDAYRYMAVLFYHYGSVISEQTSWDKALKTVYYGIRNYIKEYSGRIPEDALDILRKKNEEIFIERYKSNPVERYCESKEDVTSFQITYMLMKYLYENGKEIEELDYDKIEESWKEAIKGV